MYIVCEILYPLCKYKKLSTKFVCFYKSHLIIKIYKCDR